VTQDDWCIVTWRWRLTLFYAALSSTLLILTGSMFVFGLRSNLERNLNDGLRDTANLAARQISGDEGQPVFSEGVGVGQFGTQLETRGETTVIAFNAAGRETDRFGRPRIQAPLQVGFAHVDGLRSFTLRLEHGAWVQTLRSERPALEVIDGAQRLLLWTVPIMLVLGSIAGYALAGRALRPVDQVTRLASRIASSGRYRDRVPETPGEDEMARLTRTVNAMLGRLEVTIERERAFALAAAHELRTPLALIHGQANLILKREREAEAYRKGFEEVAQTSLEMTAMIESLLALARTNQVPVQQTVNLEDLALEVVESFTIEAQRRSIRLLLETQSTPTLGDPMALRLVIGNLIGNAIKYGHEHGHVWIRTSKQNTQVVLEVSDDGPGIPDEHLQSLQQPFQRGLGLQGVHGAGLGLALVVAVIEQHSGRLELHRAEEGGLRVRVQLALADD
jgi:signal transduction histidine kinase